ncbi:MAG: outer membrane beta-barrel protein [Prevotella sp.]|nr:outer membrane beta-barrel protein [Prevotella sp.]
MITDVCKSFDWGIPVGLSYEYKNISLDARYYFGLTKIDKTENPDNAQNRYLSITLGYRFHL